MLLRLRSGCVRSFLLADRIEDADETALIAREDGNQTVQRALERAHQFGKELDLRGECGERRDLRGIDERAVEIRRFDVEFFDAVGKGLEGFGGRDGIFAREENNVFFTTA